jgi:hypothetical protein
MTDFTIDSPPRHAAVTGTGEVRVVRERDGRVRFALTAAGCVVGVLLLSKLVLRADAAAAWHAMAGAGPLVATALMPFAVGMAIDAYGTVTLLRALGHRTTLWQMLPVRMASEALHLSMPAGVVAADAATAALLEARCGVRLRDGMVASIARRWLVMRAHAGYIVIGAAVGFSTLASLSRGILGGAGLPWLVLASSLVPLTLSAAVAAGLLGQSTFAKLHSALGRLPSRRLARWLQSRRQEATATDEQVARLRGARSAAAAATFAFLVSWCFEALESALILRLLGAGASVDLRAVFAIEAGQSLVRSAAVIAPSGLGVVDLGYGAVLPLLGADAGVAPAFVVLKRAKEALWVLAGYAVLAFLRGRPQARCARCSASASTIGPILGCAGTTCAGTPSSAST